MDAKAFCPGHITGFFEICDSDDILAKGSRGAGLCIALGATSIVKVENSVRQQISVKIDGRESKAEVTTEAVRHILGHAKSRVQVSTTLDLPQSQGFGMSAAGSLSSALALTHLLGDDRQRAFEAAHIAEIKGKCGLGDVSAIHGGGITIRKKPGLPPKGEVVRIPGAPNVVLAVVGGKLLTRDVLSDAQKRDAINASGSSKVDELVKSPSLEKLMELSADFASETGLASRKILETMGAASKLGMASMSMLGNSVFAIGDVPGLESVLSGFGRTWTCKVDTEGPRIL